MTMRLRLSQVLISCFAAVLVSSCTTTQVKDESVKVEARARLEPTGAINPVVSQASIRTTICVSGWTTTVRPSTSYTNAVKATLLREHGLTQSDAALYELDHFIPLALGGHPRDLHNLWLQPWDGQWGAKTKDHLEVKLKNLVCANQLALEAARDAIRVDWRAAFKRYVGAVPASHSLELPEGD